MLDRPLRPRILVLGSDASARRAIRDAITTHGGSASANLSAPGFAPTPEVDEVPGFDEGVRQLETGVQRTSRYGCVVVLLNHAEHTTPGADAGGWGALPGELERLLDHDPDIHLVLCLDDAGDGVGSPITDPLESHPLADRCVLLRQPPTGDPRTLSRVVTALLDAWNTSQRLRAEVDDLRTGPPPPAHLPMHPPLDADDAHRVIVDPDRESPHADPGDEHADSRLAPAGRPEVEARLRHAALHDPLTGLPNRSFLLSRLRWCMDRLGRRADYMFAVLFIDLDNFKLINDSLGHETGDRLLISIANRLRSSLRSIDSLIHLQSDTTARLGGDEFVVLLDGITRVEDAVIVAERLGKVLSEPFSLGKRRVVASASIGIAVSNESYRSGEEMLRDADMAMYRAKQGGKGRHALFDRALHEEAVARLQMENDLRESLADGLFRVAFQPIMSVGQGGLSGFEALLRWDRPDGVDIGPAEFVPIAEEMGLIVPLGRWVLGEACRTLAMWRERHPDAARDLIVSVNLSRRQIVEPGLLEMVDDVLRETGLPGEALNLEITESAVVGDITHAGDLLHAIKARGIRLMMDDFGTGLSSLSCLHELPVDVLKIHRSFIMNMDDNRRFAAVVHAILTLASHLDMKVVAEGVEHEGQMAGLIALGADYIQGFHIARALSAHDAERMIAEGLTAWPTPTDEAPDQATPDDGERGAAAA